MKRGENLSLKIAENQGNPSKDHLPKEAMKTLRDFIAENFLFGEWNEFNENTSFLESGIVDSTGMLEIISFLEERHGITVEDDELVPDNFDSLNQLDAFLARKLREQAGGRSSAKLH
jgi:acyl carrier protein